MINNFEHIIDVTQLDCGLQFQEQFIENQGLRQPLHDFNGEIKLDQECDWEDVSSNSDIDDCQDSSFNSSSIDRNSQISEQASTKQFDTENDKSIIQNKQQLIKDQTNNQRQSQIKDLNKALIKDSKGQDNQLNQNTIIQEKKKINLKKYTKILKKKFNLSNQEINTIKYKFDSFQQFKKWFREYSFMKINEINKYLKIEFREVFKSIDQKMRKMKQETNQLEIQKWKVKHQKHRNQKKRLAGSKRQQITETLIQEKDKIIENLKSEIKSLQLQLSIKTDFFEQESLNLQQVQNEVQRVFDDKIKNLKEENEKLKLEINHNEKLTQVKLEDPKKRELKLEKKKQSKQYQKRQGEIPLDTRDRINNGSYNCTKFKWGMRRTNKNSYQYQGCIKDQAMWNQIFADHNVNELGNLFDAIVMDPPWNDTACKLGYQILKDIEIFQSIPIQRLQKNGYLFIWITNSKLESCLQYLKSIGYKRAEILTWVKLNEDKTLHSGIGFDLRHVTEFCVVARPENKFSELKKISFTHNVPNIIISPVRLVSQKPDQLYEYIEQLLPNRKYAEIFGRPHNHRPYWTTIGNESIHFLNGQPSKVNKQ